MAGFLDTIFGGGAQEDAAAKNAAALQSYQGTALPALQQGYTTGTGALNSAIGAYTPLANLGQQYTGAGGMLMNSLGLNGPQGNATAASTFQNDPGTIAAQNAAIEVMNRRRAGQGMNASGNADIDAMNYAQNQQNQQYQNWQSQLAGLNTLGVNATGTAAAGQASGYGGLAGLASKYGEDQSGVAGNVVSGTMADNNMVAAGQAAGAKNLLGFGMSLAGLGTGFLGGGGGGSGGSSGGSGGGFGSSLIGQGLSGLSSMGSSGSAGFGAPAWMSMFA
jgi:hypothetical protein